MFKVILRCTVRRFFELFLSAVFISGIATLIFSNINSQRIVCLGLFFGAAIFATINIIMMRQCFFDLLDRPVFYISNYLAYILFAAVNLYIFSVVSPTLYTWIFSITKIMRYTTLGYNTYGSTLFFHLMMLIVVTFSPMGMGWILTDNYFPIDTDEMFENSDE